MSTHTHEPNADAPSERSTRDADRHVFVVETERVPGPHPESHLRERGQTAYVERYLRCLRCGVERLHERAFPPTCDRGRAD